MPHVPFDIPSIGPQRAAPKGPAAINAEVKQISAKLDEQIAMDKPKDGPKPGKSKNPFLELVSINKWKYPAKTVARQLTEIC